MFLVFFCINSFTFYFLLVPVTRMLSKSAQIINNDYFSLIISEFNIFTFFRHYNSLFAINFKAVFNMTFQYFFCTKGLQAQRHKCFLPQCKK